jgi:hemerythrin-like domain-containing protein
LLTLLESDDEIQYHVHCAGGTRPERSLTEMAAKAKERNDAIALLKEDHEKVRGLLRQLEKAATSDGDEAEPLLKSIESELRVHTTIEEEIFYPAFRDAASKKDDSKLYYEAVEEHHVVDLVLPEIDKGDTGSAEFAAKAKVLKDLVEHHAEEEEKEMFPRARKLMDKDELVTLGQQLANRKRELQAENDGASEEEEEDDRD